MACNPQQQALLLKKRCAQKTARTATYIFPPELPAMRLLPHLPRVLQRRGGNHIPACDTRKFTRRFVLRKRRDPGKRFARFHALRNQKVTVRERGDLR
jgi:hypothetical protein